MDKKTHLTKYIPEFMKAWNNYKKGLKGLKITKWSISSDYCFNDPNKLNVATFTIFPVDYIPLIAKEIKENLPCDIKKTKIFSEKSLNYLKNSKYFFSIAFVVNDIERCFNKNNTILLCENLLKIKKSDLTPDIDDKSFYEKRKKLQELLNSLKKKNCPLKLFSQAYFVAHSVSQIIEFLVIKENAKNVGWCSDRGHITSFLHGLIFNIVQMYIHSYIKDRVNDYNYVVPPKSTEMTDLFIRIPDIITGVLSSLTFSSGSFSAQKSKHRQLLLNSIMNNKRIVSLIYNFDGSDYIHGHRIIFETLDKCPLFKFEREYLEKHPL